METWRLASSRQRKAAHLLRRYPGLLHPSFVPTHRWRLPIASKPAPVRNTCSRRISRCARTTCSSVGSSCREHLTSIYCPRSSSLLRMPLALVFQIQRHSRKDEKCFHRGGSTLSLATFISSRIPRVRPITAFHSR